MNIFISDWRGIVRAVAVFAFLLAVEAPAFAQDGPNTPIVSYPTNAGVSQPLWTIPGSPATLSPQKPIVRPLHPLPQRHSPASQQHAADRALQTKAGAHLAVQSKPAFFGIAQDGYIPPDPNIAVGPNHIVQVVNSAIAVFDKSGNAYPGYPKKLSSLWSSLGGGCGSKNAGDPVVQYDAFANRWIITQLGSLRRPYSECFAVSKSSDPTGAYYVYSYDFGGNLNDYPKFGVWPTTSNSAYLGTYNIFANGSVFSGAELCAYDRAAMLNGDANPAQVCFTISNDGGFLPADVDGKTPPTDGSPGYFLNFETLSSLRLYKLTPDFTTPSNSTLSSPTGISVNSFKEACGGGTCIPQPGTSQQLDSLGDRLMYRLAYRNFGGHESMVVNHSVVAGSSVGVRWYELRATTPGQFSLYQQGTFAPDSSYRWMGSIAMDQSGDMALGYSRSSSNVYPGIYLTGRTPSDSLGTMEAETTLQAGGGSQTGYSRWGDYTSMRIDPSDDCTFWYTDEYYPTSASYNWYTYIGSFKFSNCGSTASSADFSISETPSPMTIDAGSSDTGTITITPLNGFNSDVTLSTSCSTPLTCQLSPNPATASSGYTSTLTISVATGATTGTELFEITGTGGGLTHSTTMTVDYVKASSFALSASPSPLTLYRSSSPSSGTETITVSGSGTISLSVSGLPAHTSASFDTTTVKAPGTATLTIQAGPHGPTGTYQITVQGTESTGTTQSTTFELTIVK